MVLIHQTQTATVCILDPASRLPEADLITPGVSKAMQLVTQVQYGIVGTALALGLLCSVAMGQHTQSHFHQLCLNEPPGDEYHLCMMEQYTNMVTNLLRQHKLTPQTVKCNSDILRGKQGTCAVIVKEYENFIKITYTKDGKLVNIDQRTGSTIRSGSLYVRPKK